MNSSGVKMPVWIYGLAGGLGIVISRLLIVSMLDITGFAVFIIDFVVILVCILAASFIYQKRR